MSFFDRQGIPERVLKKSSAKATAEACARVTSASDTSSDRSGRSTGGASDGEFDSPPDGDVGDSDAGLEDDVAMLGDSCLPAPTSRRTRSSSSILSGWQRRSLRDSTRTGRRAYACSRTSTWRQGTNPREAGRTSGRFSYTKGVEARS